MFSTDREARNFLLFCIIGALITILVSNVFTACDNKCPPEKSCTNYSGKDVVAYDNTIFDRSVIKLACLEGHIYYYFCRYDQISLFSKLDDSGKPVTCPVEKESASGPNKEGT